MLSASDERIALGKMVFEEHNDCRYQVRVDRGILALISPALPFHPRPLTALHFPSPAARQDAELRCQPCRSC